MGVKVRMRLRSRGEGLFKIICLYDAMVVFKFSAHGFGDLRRPQSPISLLGGNS